jgi:hypothetical protein
MHIFKILNRKNMDVTYVRNNFCHIFYTHAQKKKYTQQKFNMNNRNIDPYNVL